MKELGITKGKWKSQKQILNTLKEEISELKKQNSELLQRYNEAIEVLELAKEHLEYCNYGDNWEMECAYAQGLPEKIEQTISKAKP